MVPAVLIRMPSADDAEIVPPDPLLAAPPSPTMVNEPFVFVSVMPVPVALVDETLVRLMPSVVRVAELAPAMLIAFDVVASTVPVVTLRVFAVEALVSEIPFAPLVKMLTVPRLYVPVPLPIVPGR